MSGDSDWAAYRELVLSEIRRLNGSILEVDVKLNDIRVQVAMLTVKAGIWGGLAGLIPVLIALGFYVLGK